MVSTEINSSRGGRVQLFIDDFAQYNIWNCFFEVYLS